MIKKAMKRACSLLLCAVLAVPATLPSATAEAAAPTMDGHGLTGAWYKAEDGSDREDLSRFTFEEDRYLGSEKTACLDGENFKPLIADLIGSSDDSQFVLARFTGELEVPKEEAYTFYMIGDDGFRLYIDDELVIDFWCQDWDKEQKSEPITLTEGRHDIRVEYLQGWGGAYVKLEWESASTPREVVPESALYQTKENYYQDAKNALTTEIEKCQEVCKNVAGSQESIQALEEELAKAIEIRDGDYSDIEDVQVIIDMMNQAVERLQDVKTQVYLSTGVQESSYHTQFTNPLYQGQDPFVTQKDGFYYLVASSNDDNECKIYVSKSRTLTDQGEKKMVMDMTGKQRRIFAPEMFFLNDEDGGHWYIYYCADVINYERDYPEMAAKYDLGSESHIVFCLRSKTADPMGEYEDMGPLYCGEDGVILGANDVTMMEYDGSLFLIWGTLGANQPLGPAIVEMDTPTSVTKDRDMLPIGGGEGPRVLKNENGDLFVTMSEGGYSTDGYRLSLLCFTGNSKEELLDESKWYAVRDVFTSTTSVSGPARASFVKSADGTEDWMVYHSRVYKETGNNWWRQVNIKKFDWTEEGLPDFGTPASPNQKYDLPSGDPGQGDQYEAEGAILEGGSCVSSDNSNYFGEGYVEVPNTKGAAVSFVVDAEEAGDYIVGLRYAYGVQKDGETTNNPTSQLPTRAVMNIYVNGEQVDQIQMDKNSITWNEWFTGSKRLTLNEGANLITYSVDQGCTGNVHMDTLTMYKADVPYTKAEINPKSVNLEKDYAVLEEGESTQIQAKVVPENAGNQQLVYTSSDEQTATVDAGGKVTALKEGEATITVTAAGNKAAAAKFRVFVTEKKQEANTGGETQETVIRPAYVELSSKKTTMVVGKTKSLNPKVYPSYAKDTTVSYQSSNPKVATVDEKGVVTAKSAGTAVITVTANGDTTVKQTCSVTVKPAKVTKVKASRLKKGAVRLSWKKQSGVDGYQIYRSDKRNGGYKLVKTIKKSSVTKFTDKKAKKGKVYYYKVRAYKKSSSGKITGAYSTIRKVKK